MKKINMVLKILLVFVTIMYMLNCVNISKVYATSYTAGEIVSGADDFINKGQSGSSYMNQDQLKIMSDTIYNILLITGIIIAFVVGIILGIKYVTGGIEEQVDVKKTMVPYIIGCIILFGAFTIWKIVVIILQG